MKNTYAITKSGKKADMFNLLFYESRTKLDASTSKLRKSLKTLRAVVSL